MALQSFGVKPAGFRRIPRNYQIRRHILYDNRRYCSQTVAADAAKLVNPGETAQNHMVSYAHMTGECRMIGHDGVVAHEAIVGDMYISHYPVTVTQPGDTTSVSGAAIYRTKFADGVTIANLQARLDLSMIFLVLGILADRTELENPVILANSCRPFYDNMRAYAGALPDFNRGINNGVGTYLYSAANLCLRMNNRRLMNQEPLSDSVVNRLADATTLSPTLALAENFQIFRLTVT